MKRKAMHRFKARDAAKAALWMAFALMAGAGAARAQSFAASAPVGRPYTPVSRMVLADFNQDGFADLATVGYLNGNTSNNNAIYLQVYLGDGQGNFAASPSAFTNVNGCSGVKDLAVMGLDTSGNQNLAVLCYDTLQIWHVQSNPGSSAPVAFINNPSYRQVILLATGGQAMAVTDLFGTGNAGIAVLESGTDYYNRSVEYFAPPSGCSPAQPCGGSSAFMQLSTTATAIDLAQFVSATEHGKAIVAVPQPGSSTPALVVTTINTDSTQGGSIVSLLPQPSGTFVLGEVRPLPVGLFVTAAATGDFSQNGLPALVLAGSRTVSGGATTGFVSVYTCYGDGTFGSTQVDASMGMANMQAPVDSRGLAVLDVNGDGNADILVGGPYPQGVSAGTDTFSIFLGNGDGTFTYSQSPGPNVNKGNVDLGTGLVALAAANINADGSPDVAAIDLVGDGSGGGVGYVQQIAGSLVQVFSGRTASTTTTLTTSTGSSSGGGGLLRRMSAVRPLYSGPGSYNATLTATVTPAQATGWVQFFDATTQSYVATAQLSNGQASATVSGMVGHLFVASYYGDATYIGSASDAVRATPDKQPVSVQIDVDPVQAAPGTAINFSAYVSGDGGVPTGTVSFIDNNTASVLATAMLDSNGNAATSLSNLPDGQYDVIASYPGDGLFLSGTSVDIPLTIAVPLVADTVSLAVTPASVMYPGTVSATATFTSAGSSLPTGPVNLQLDGVTVASPVISGSSATATLTPGPGTHRLQAVYAGDGTAAPSTSNTVTIDVQGGVLQFTPGAATTLAGVPGTGNGGSFGGDGGAATSAYLNTPLGLASDGGNVYIADEQNNVIRKVDAHGVITTVAGQPYAGSYYSTRYGGDGGPATSAYLDNPAAVVVDAGGNLFIADYSNNVVRRVDAGSGIITTVAGVAGSPGYNGDSGAALTVHLNRPSALAFDAAGNLYIADTKNNLVRKMDTGGNVTTVAGLYGYSGGPVYGGLATQSTLNGPQGVAFDAAGNLYIADTGNNVVSKVDTNGIVTRFAGGSGGYAPLLGDGGPATAASLNQPTQLALDRAGDLYISDSINNLVRKVDVNGIITTVAGMQGASASGRYDPAGIAATSAPLVAPGGVAVDAAGNLLVADTANQTVWRVGPMGVLQFGPQAAGTTSDPLSVTLFNAGDRALTFDTTPYTVTGDYIVGSGGSAPCDFTAQLAAGASCTLAVQYRPQTGVLRGSIVFAGPGLNAPTVTLITNNNVPPTTTTLYLSSAAINQGDSLLIYGQVTPASPGPTPSGKLSFYDASTLLGSTGMSGGAGYIYNTTLAAGTHALTAVYGGDGYNAASTSDPMSVTVYTPTQTALAVSRTSVSAGSSVTLTATVSSGGAALGSGNVTFFDGSNALGTVNVNANGVALLATPGLSGGTHSFTATYNAQGLYGSSTSAAVNVTASTGGSIQGLDYVVSLGGQTPLVLHRGQTKTVLVSASQLGPNYQGQVTLACGTLPAYVTCSFSPATLTIGGPVQNLSSVLTLTAAP